VVEGSSFCLFLLIAPLTSLCSAPEAVIRAAGGCLTDSHGKVLPYFKNSPHNNKEGVLCTLRDHQRLTQMINAGNQQQQQQQKQQQQRSSSSSSTFSNDSYHRSLMKLGALVGVGVILTAIYLRAKH
jgi:hypothetical protein